MMAKQECETIDQQVRPYGCGPERIVVGPTAMTIGCLCTLRPSLERQEKGLPLTLDFEAT